MLIMGKVLILGIRGNHFVYEISAIRDVLDSQNKHFSHNKQTFFGPHFEYVNWLTNSILKKIPAFYFSETLLFPKKAHFR